MNSYGSMNPCGTESQNTEKYDEVFEWWLVTPYMAELLKGNGEIILADYDCYWRGRANAGQALWMDYVVQKIAQQTER